MPATAVRDALAAALLLGLCAPAGCDWPLCPDSCPDGKRCLAGECVEDPCVNRECGDDGHGGSCGTCQDGFTCREDHCIDASRVCGAGGHCPCCTATGDCLLCPTDMVQLGQQCRCIDRYEAGRGPSGQAISLPAVMPWHDVIWVDAKEACLAANKRLCTREEWESACIGSKPCDRSCLYSCACFPFGTTYADLCNGPPSHPSLPPSGNFIPTGSLPGCVGGLPGLHDMGGNLREWVDDCDARSCTVKGGSFLDDDPDEIGCVGVDSYSDLTHGIGTDDWIPSYEGYDVGFRCCLTLKE